MIDSEHPGASAVIGVFKVAALVVLVGGVIAAAVIGFTGSSGAATTTTLTTSTTSGARIGLAVGVGLGSVLYASVLAFFAYVLEYLIEIRDNTDQPRVEAQRS